MVRWAELAHLVLLPTTMEKISPRLRLPTLLICLVALSLCGSLLSCTAGDDSGAPVKTDPTASGESTDEELHPALLMALELRPWYGETPVLAGTGAFFQGAARDYVFTKPEEFNKTYGSNSGGESGIALMQETLELLEGFLMKTSPCAYEKGFIANTEVTREQVELCNSEDINNRFECAKSIALLDVLNCLAVQVPKSPDNVELCTRWYEEYGSIFGVANYEAYFQTDPARAVVNMCPDIAVPDSPKTPERPQTADIQEA